MSSRLLIRSLSIRALLALGLVLVGYVALHDRFAAIDARVAGWALAALGLTVSSPEPGSLLVQAGESYDVYAIVTGSCSSAAGALGLAAVATVLLPGQPARRLAGAALAIALFASLNLLRIVSILGLGWWLAVAGTGALLASLGIALAAVALVAAIARGIVVRLLALIAAFVLAVLAYDVARGYDYVRSMEAYHALAGPVLTFGSLALALLLLWRAIVGPPAVPADAT